MALRWVHEYPAVWDADKARIVGGEERGVFAVAGKKPGEIVPGEWWRVEDGGETVGYGWLEHTWGDAEILLAVASGHRRRGVGGFILDRLDDEAAKRGIHYLCNVVPERHPDPEGLTRWLESRGFGRSHEDRSLRRKVRSPR